MTGLQEIQDDVFELEAALSGKRMELAMAQGERETARHHQHVMYAAIQARRAFRLGVSEGAGHCFFVASAEADLMGMQGVRHG